MPWLQDSVRTRPNATWRDIMKTPAITFASDKDPLSYKLGEPMTFCVSVADVPDDAHVRWSLTDDDGRNQCSEASVEPGTHTGDAIPAIQAAGLSRPGFVRVIAEIVDGDGKPLARFDGGAGAAVSEIRADFPEPPDFDAFWAHRKAMLAGLSLDGAVRHQIPVARNDVRLFEISLPCLGTRPSTGLLSIPNASGQYPIHVNYHGYNESWESTAYGIPSPEKLSTSEIVLNFSSHGYEFGKEPQYYAEMRAKCGSGGYDYAFDPVQNTNPETAYFSGMSWRGLRALEYLKRLPEWDGKTLIVEGGSCGALQSIWAAALDHAVTECRIFIPWCCNIGGPAAGRAHGDWHIAWVNALGYYDTVNMAPRIPDTCTANIRWAGLGDYICPPSGVMAFYNALRCPKNIAFVQGATHGYYPSDTAVSKLANNHLQAKQ